MKKTLLLMAALFTLGSAAVSAQDDEIIDFDGSFYHSWSEVSASATDNGAVEGTHIKLGEEVALGGTIWGDLSGSVPYLNYANLSEYSEMIITGTPNAVLRLMCNRLVNEGAIYEIKPTIPTDGVLTISISDLKYLNGGTACDFVCLQSIKVPAGWQGGTTAATITSIKLVKPGDPLAVPKADLKKKINEAKKKNAYAKTTESWNALTKALADAVTELASNKATAESLSKAGGDLDAAMAGLTLADGYSDLTKEMFKTWASHTATEGTVNAGCVYNLNTSSDMLYGLSTVDWLNYADLSGYDKLVIIMSDGAPRFCFNRMVDGGQDNEENPSAHQMIDIPGKSWGTAKYQSVDEKVYTIDLAAIVSDEDFAHLHCIKGAYGAKVIISEMLLYKDPAITLTSSADLQGYKTFCNAEQAYSVDDQTTIYKVVSLSEEKAIVEAVAGSIVPAATPVILKTSNTEDYKITLTPTAEASTDDFGDNMLEVAVPTFEPTGYVLGYTAADGIAFYGGQTIIDGDVYLPALVAIGGAKGRLSISFGGEATAINGVDAKSAQEGAIYNVAGQKVNAAYKGIVIKNGKKYLNK